MEVIRGRNEDIKNLGIQTLNALNINSTELYLLVCKNNDGEGP